MSYTHAHTMEMCVEHQFIRFRMESRRDDKFDDASI